MKKYLLALAVVVAMAGVAVAAHEPQPIPPVPVKPENVIVISKDNASVGGSGGVSVDIRFDKISADKDSFAKQLESEAKKKFDGKKVVLVDSGIDGSKSYDKAPVTFIPLSVDTTVSWDTTITIDLKSFDMAQFKGGTAQAMMLATKSHDKIVAGNVYTDPYVVFSPKSSDKSVVDAKITIKNARAFFSENEVFVYKFSEQQQGGSSSSGCNVGFAPMALLLGLPLFFLKK